MGDIEEELMEVGWGDGEEMCGSLGKDGKNKFKRELDKEVEMIGTGDNGGWEDETNKELNEVVEVMSRAHGR